MLGLALPRACGAVMGDRIGQARAVLWLGPDEFSLVEPEVLPAVGAARGSALVAAVENQPGQMVALSANRTWLELSGGCAREVVEKSCALDVHDRALPVGTAVSTMFGAFKVPLWRVGVQEWCLESRVRFAVALAEWLCDGMREFEYAVNGAQEHTH